MLMLLSSRFSPCPLCLSGYCGRRDFLPPPDPLPLTKADWIGPSITEASSRRAQLCLVFHFGRCPLHESEHQSLLLADNRRRHLSPTILSRCARVKDGRSRDSVTLFLSKVPRAEKTSLGYFSGRAVAASIHPRTSQFLDEFAVFAGIDYLSNESRWVRRGLPCPSWNTCDPCDRSAHCVGDGRHELLVFTQAI